VRRKLIDASSRKALFAAAFIFADELSAILFGHKLNFSGIPESRADT
jgi:hypothetical protein